MQYIRFVFYALTAVVLLASCQQEVSDILPDTNNPSDSTALPDSAVSLSNHFIRQIHITGELFSDPVNLTFTIQYDTFASKITVLMKDSIGDATLIDPTVKGAVYAFNRAGYLMRSDLLKTNGTQAPYFSITRNAANQIEKIIEYYAEEVNGVSYNDTIWYRYGTGFIEDSVRRQSFLNPSSFSYARKVRTFDAQNRIQSFKYYAGHELYNEYAYRYDAQNNINRRITNSDTTDYTYDVQRDTAWKYLPELFLGKDAYVLMKESTDDFGYNFLTFVIEDEFETIYNPLFTQPLTRMARHGRRILNPNEEWVQSVVTFSTTYTPDGKIKTIAATPEGKAPIRYTFSY